MQPIEALELFNQKAERLSQLGFVRAFGARRPRFHLLPGKSGVQITAEGVAAREELEAFALTLRFFLQSSDGISLRQIPALYAKLAVPDELAAEVDEVRRDLNRYLDGASPFVEDDPSRQLTRRELLNMVLYGDLAHANEAQRKRWKRWTSTGFDTLIESEFADMVAGVVQPIFWVRQVNLKALVFVRGATGTGRVAPVD
ncbi:MAG TPA: hypothetical protein VFK04_04130 [Gemmatimonadaceae bacterium]|nr:hypothetical protein [Gemmatimonadaceae bacterium]